MRRAPPPRSSLLTRRRALAGAVGLGVAGAVLACGRDARAPQVGSGVVAPRRGGLLRGLVDEEPATLDPITPSGGVGNQLAAFAYSRLVRFRPGRGAPADGTVEGDLALSWEQPDPTTLLFRLRDNARFDPRPPTDGRPVEAADVVASWDTFVARGTYRADLAAAADPDAPVVSLRAAGSQAIELRLAAPDAQVLPTLASRFGLWVLPREAFEGGFNSQTEMRGSGPWLLERHQPSVGLSFRHNPAWFRAPEEPLLDGVDLPVILDAAQAEAQFRARRIHGGPALGSAAVLAPNILAVHRSLPDTRIDLGPPPVLGPTIAFGWRDAAFRDPRVRRAISMLIDRDAFIEAFNDVRAFQSAGVALRPAWTTPLSPAWGPFWLDPRGARFGPGSRSFRHDVAEARRMLAAAGYPDGFETPFTFIAGPNWGRDWQRRAEALMAMLGEGGVRCRANPVELNGVFIPQYLRRAGDFEGLAMQRTGSRGDPGQFWSIFFSSTGASNQVGRQFPELDALILRQRRELDRDRRIALHHEIQRYFAEQMPAVPQGGHTEEPLLSWKELQGPDEVSIWGGGDLGAEAYPSYWLDAASR